MLEQQQGEQQAERVAERGADMQLVAAGASVILSWYMFFVRGDREMGLFIGLWPPTQLAFASYLKNTKISEQLDDIMPTRRSMMDSFEDIFART